MMWRTLLAAALLLPPLAYVAGALVADEPAPEQRPALVLDEDDRGPGDSEQRVTIRPKRDDGPDRSSPPPQSRDDDADDRSDDGDDDDDDDDAEVVRPIPDEVDDDDDGDDDDRGRDRDD